VELGHWRIYYRVLPGGLVGLVLYGPRKRVVYIPPFFSRPERLPIPRYVARFLSEIVPELREWGVSGHG